MDETVITTQESAMDTGTPVDTQPTDQTDDFLAGFDDEPDTAEQAGQPEDAEDGSAEPKPEQTSTVTEPSAPTDGAPEHEPEQPDKEAEAEKPAERAWDFKYMGQQMHMTADQITPELLQKGHDYDRVRSKYDEAKPMIEIFTELARNANMSLEDFTKSVRMEAKRAQGMSDADAKRVVELEDREAVVSAAETARREAEAERGRKNDQIRNDLDMFRQAYPEVYDKARGGDQSAIPQAVWDEVNRGAPLVAAYSRYLVAQAADQIKATEQRAATAAKNAENAARSSGSMKSAGNDAKNTDPFLDGFDG